MASIKYCRALGYCVMGLEQKDNVKPVGFAQQKKSPKLAAAIVIVIVLISFLLWAFYAQINNNEFFEHCKHEIDSHVRSLKAEGKSDEEIASSLNDFVEKIGCPQIQN